MEINLKENLAIIVNALERHQNMKFTHIAKAIGFTTTTQLHNAMGATSGISAKAIIGIIANLNVNPTFLFFGKGEMFLTDENELEAIQKEKSEWEKKFFSMQDELFKCKAELERAVHRYNKLIDITSIALDKTQKPED
jgi:hypothetical protein